MTCALDDLNEFKHSIKLHLFKNILVDFLRGSTTEVFYRTLQTGSLYFYVNELVNVSFKKYTLRGTKCNEITVTVSIGFFQAPYLVLIITEHKRPYHQPRNQSNKINIKELN